MKFVVYRAVFYKIRYKSELESALLHKYLDPSQNNGQHVPLKIT
jgi:hypothetical protein